MEDANFGKNENFSICSCPCPCECHYHDLSGCHYSDPGYSCDSMSVYASSLQSSYRSEGGQCTGKKR